MNAFLLAIKEKFEAMKQNVNIADDRLEKLMQALFGRIKDVNTSYDFSEDGNKCTALYFASVFSSAYTVQALIDKGADVTLANSSGETEGFTPLYSATSYGRVDNVKCLLAADANPNTPIQFGHDVGMTSFYSAACNGQTQIIKIFLEQKSDPNQANPTGQDQGNTPLYIAAYNGKEEVVSSKSVLG